MREDMKFSREAHLVFHWCLYNKSMYHIYYYKYITNFGI